MKTENSLTLSAYNEIRQLIFQNRIIPGQRLYLVDLAKQLGMSRLPVTYALSILANEGYLDFVPNYGYTVHVMNEEEGRNLFEIREMIEIGAIDLSARKISVQKMEKLARALKNYERAIWGMTHHSLFVLDTEFHVSVIEMSENPLLVERFKEIFLKIFSQFGIENIPVARIREIVEEHNEIFHALENKDLEYAKQIIHVHNENAQENLFSAFDRNRRKKQEGSRVIRLCDAVS